MLGPTPDMIPLAGRRLCSPLIYLHMHAFRAFFLHACMQGLAQGLKDARAPHEFYRDTVSPPTLQGLRWSPDPRVLQPEVLHGLASDPGGPELVREKVS